MQKKKKKNRSRGLKHREKERISFQVIKILKKCNTAVTLTLELSPVFFFKSSATWRKERKNSNIDNGLEVPVDSG